MAAPPVGNGKTLGSDYFIHPLSDLALGIPAETDVVLITSNSNGTPASATTQNSARSQAALLVFLDEGGTLVVDMGDNLGGGGFIAPGAIGTPTLIFPSPCDQAIIHPFATTHQMVRGPDGVQGTADDLTNGNVSLGTGCFVAHGNLEEGIRLPADAKPLMAARFNGDIQAIMAEYCVGRGLVILDTNTKEFVGQNPTFGGAGIVMRNLFDYALVSRKCSG